VTSQVLSSLVLNKGSFGRKETPSETSLNSMYAFGLGFGFGWGCASHRCDVGVGCGVRFVMFTLIGVAATVWMAFLRKEPSSPQTSASQSSSHHLWATLSLARRERRLWLMIPSNCAFGLVQGFQNGVFAGVLVAKSLGVGNVGNLGAISSFSGAVVSIPFGRWSDSRAWWGGRSPVMVVGFVCHVVVALVLWSIGENVENDSWALLCTMSAMLGTARGPSSA
jgi:Na+/melibiose symporter-like transporter